MCGLTAGVWRGDDSQRQPSDGEVQPVARGISSQMFQHDVDRQRTEL